MVAFRKKNRSSERDLFSLETLTSRIHNAAEYCLQLNPGEGGFFFFCFLLLFFSLRLNSGAPGKLFDLVPPILIPDNQYKVSLCHDRPDTVCLAVGNDRPNENVKQI